MAVIVGWYTKNLKLIQISSSFVPMQFNTALGFLLSGIGVFSISIKKNRIALACGIIISLLAVLTLVEYSSGLELYLDQLFMKHYITAKTFHPGRMAPNTALCFGLFGSALIIICRSERHKFNIPTAGHLGFLVAALGTVSLVGYIGNISTSIKISFHDMVQPFVKQRKIYHRSLKLLQEQ